MLHLFRHLWHDSEKLWWISILRRRLWRTNSDRTSLPWDPSTSIWSLYESILKLWIAWNVSKQYASTPTFCLTRYDASLTSIRTTRWNVSRPKYGTSSIWCSLTRFHATLTIRLTRSSWIYATRPTWLSSNAKSICTITTIILILLKKGNQTIKFVKIMWEIFFIIIKEQNISLLIN